MKKEIYLFACLLLLVFSCTSTNIENEKPVGIMGDEVKPDSVILANPNTTRYEKMDYQDLSDDLQGGIVNIQVEDINFAEPDYLFETLRTENVVSYDSSLKMVTLMAANYQNTRTNLSVTAIGGRLGKFPLQSSPERSATVTFYYNNGLANIGGALSKGTLTIEELDEKEGYAKGRFKGRTEEGSPVKATFEIRASQKAEQ